MFSGMGIVILQQPLIAMDGMVQVFGNAARAWSLRYALLRSMLLLFAVGALIGPPLPRPLFVLFINRKACMLCTEGE